MHRVGATLFNTRTASEMDWHVPHLKRRLCKDSSLIEHALTIDEIWIYHHDPVTKHESTGRFCLHHHWRRFAKLSWPPKSCSVCSLIRMALSIGILFHHTWQLPQMPTWRFSSLHLHSWSKYPAIACSFILHHENACSHTVKATLEYPSAKKIKVCHICPVVQIWPLMIFDCFQNWRNNCETGRFPQMRTSS